MLIEILPIVFTILIEGVIAYLIGYKSKKFQINLLAINILTNSLLTLWNLYSPLKVSGIVVLEILVLAVEFILLKYLLNISNLKLAILVIAINLASFGSGIIISGYKYPYIADLVVCKFSGNPVECIETKIIKRINSDPEKTKIILDEIYFLWPIIFEDIDRRSLSDFLHEIGMTLASEFKDVNKSTQSCTRHWYAGCVHGAVMEHIEIFNLNNDERFLAICNQLDDKSLMNDCIHAIGHTIWSSNNHYDINLALETCTLWKSPLFAACASGVLMEYSKGTRYEDYPKHSHNQVSSIPLPCDDIDNRFKEICYISAASYREYYPNDNIESTIEYCESIPNEYRDACFIEIKNRLNTSGI